MRSDIGGPPRMAKHMTVPTMGVPTHPLRRRHAAANLSRLELSRACAGDRTSNLCLGMGNPRRRAARHRLFNDGPGPNQKNATQNIQPRKATTHNIRHSMALCMG